MAERKKAKKNENKQESESVSASAAMQDLLKKIRLEGESAAASTEKSEVGDPPAPRYDEEMAVSTRKQLMEDYRRELLALGRTEKHSARPKLYEYEDLTPEESFPEEVSAEEIDEITEAFEAAADVKEETVEETEPASEENEAFENTEPAPEETVEEAIEDVCPARETEPLAEILTERAEEGETACETEPVEAVSDETAEALEAAEDVKEEAVGETEPAPEEIEAVPEEVEAYEKTEPAPAETVEKAMEDTRPACETEPEEAEERNSFRSVFSFRVVGRERRTQKKRIEPSKEKDPYSVHDYDMAQEFGYIPESRERTVSQVNELEETAMRRVVVYSKPDGGTREKTPAGRVRQGRTLLRKVAEGDGHHGRGRLRTGRDAPRGRTLHEPDRISERENARIRENPKKVRDAALRRVILAGIISVILCFWEYLPMLPGGSFLPLGLVANTQYPLLYIGIAALLLALDLALLGRSFYPAFSELLRLRCTPRSLAVFSVALAFLNDLFSCYVLLLATEAEYGMFHFPASLVLLFYAVGAFATVSRKIDAYAVFGAFRAKYLLTEDELCEHIRNERGEDARGGTLRCFTAANDVRGVDRRLDAEERYDGVPGFRRLFFLLILLGMTVMVLFSLRASDELSFAVRLSGAVRAFLWTIFLMLPLSVTELRRIPLLRASAEMRKRNTALAGDASALEYAAVGTVAVRSEMFFRKHPFSLGACVGEDPERVSYYLSSALTALGEPFSRAVSGNHSKKVRLIALSERTASLYVDGLLVELRLGDSERYGYRLSDPGASLRESAYRIPLCIAVEGESIGTCSLYVQNDAEYPALVRALHDHGLRIDTCHYTFMPFLTERTLQIPVPSSNRKKRPEVRNLAHDTVAARLQSSAIRDGIADSGIVAMNAPRDIWLPLVYADKITAYNRFAAVLSWLSVLTGALLSVLTVLGVLPIVSYPILVSLLPIVFGALTYLFSNYYLS